MPTRSLRIVNRSTHQSARIDAAIDAMTGAVRIQLRDVARQWGEYVWQVVDDANRQGFEVVLLDDSDAAGALGYHDLDADGRSYACGSSHRSSTTAAPGSAVRTPSRRPCRTRRASWWATRPRTTGSRRCTGKLVAVELCDPVESCAYTITLPDGRRVSVSDFVYPDWFNPYAEGKQLDHMNVLHAPFKSTEGGYVLHHTGEGVRTVWGRDTTLAPGRKAAPVRGTYIRHRLG